MPALARAKEVAIKRHELMRFSGAPCEHCWFAEICDVKSTLASRFFFNPEETINAYHYLAVDF